MNDAATGLVYMQQRYYDPVTGRFISPDPIRPTPGNIYNLNRYVYAANSPIRYTDPDGRCIDGVTCGSMMINHVEWRMSHPGAPLDGLEKAAIVGVGMMASATGGTEAGGFVFGVRALVRVVVRRVIKTDSAKQIEKTAARSTRSGEKDVRISNKDGSVTDISPQRVKKYVPNTHPKAPKGALQKVKFKNAQPGTKGFKRDPTPEELKTLRDAE